MIRRLLTTACVMAMAATAAPTIGTITSNGRFQMNGAEVWNQSALLEGASIRTEISASRLLLRNGTDLRLGASTVGTVFADRVQLDSGAIEGLLPSAFQLETKTLGVRIQGENARAHVRVQDGTVLVASIEGMVRVRGSQGLLLAELQEGHAVQLSAASQGAQAGAQLTGVVQHRNYRYFLTDETNGVTVELRGESVAKSVGRRVTITGEVDTAVAPVGKAEYAVRVLKIEEAPEPESGTAAKKQGGGAQFGPAKKAGIIAGVVVAAAATTGLVVAGGEDKRATVSPQP